MHDRTIVVTGATSGVGFAVCALLAAENCRILAVGHSAENCERAKSALLKKYPGADITFFYGCLEHQHEVIRVAGELKQYLDGYCNGRLWGLVNNAGCVCSWYMTTDEGYEKQFALNHLAGFALAFELLPYLKSAGGRVLFTSSRSHRKMRIRWDDLMFQRRYRPLLVYKQSKLCNILTALALNERFGRDGVRAYAVDPGLVDTGIGSKKTGWLVDTVWRLRRHGGIAPDVPAKTYAHLLLQSAPPAGLYFRDCRPALCSREVNGPNAGRLFQISAGLCGLGAAKAAL